MKEKKYKKCPCCNNMLELPKEYFNAVKVVRKEIEKFEKVIRKDHEIEIRNNWRCVKCDWHDKKGRCCTKTGMTLYIDFVFSSYQILFEGCIHFEPKELGDKNNMDEKLKPCPFCGGDGKIYTGGTYYKITYQVVCEKCGARGKWYVLEKDAIKAWNKRVKEQK